MIEKLREPRRTGGRLVLHRCTGHRIAPKPEGREIFWLHDESLEDTGNLPAPELIAAEIVEDLQSALDQFAEITASLSASGAEPDPLAMSD